MRGVKWNVEERNKIVASFTTDECSKIDDHLFVTLPADDYLREMSRKSLEEADLKIKECRANNCGEDELSYFEQRKRNAEEQLAKSNPEFLQDAEICLRIMKDLCETSAKELCHYESKENYETAKTVCRIYVKVEDGIEKARHPDRQAISD
jgi:DNA-directed RNA polymerase subunit M/transcription elongation factor TFIIS